ncbi:hypothetical protein RMSM_07706 [Rhodopirellula maiorica SM1]|uniref:Transcobalamin-like C-terminal domain-containing protein n=1 Tax=Rhodopirellula maiorica SM1 TaxID=1265738 RepID=M5RJ30_9BACT|nr:DUF4430 domain-containing protein [Rhodopirellula maiorica]EMI15377.1 hypothetical protein RMSM_07706 [Rhodopirellula maiorica SM1]
MKNTSKTQSKFASHCGVSWPPIDGIAIGLIAMTLLIAGCGKTATDTPEPATINTAEVAGSDVAQGDTIEVTVVIQGNDEKQTFTRTDIPTGATVEQVMRSIDEVPVTITGSGMTAFVSEIDGVSTTSSEGWKYKVDGVHADKGIGSTKLDAASTITWAFGSYEDE